MPYSATLPPDVIASAMSAALTDTIFSSRAFATITFTITKVRSTNALQTAFGSEYARMATCACDPGISAVAYRMSEIPPSMAQYPGVAGASFDWLEGKM